MWSCALRGGSGVLATRGDDRMIQTLILRGIDPPYLIVRVVPSLFHVTVLPAHLSEQDLTALARAQVRANGFDACLVLAARHGLALPAEGAEHAHQRPNWSGNCTASGLATPPVAGGCVRDRRVGSGD